MTSSPRSPINAQLTWPLASKSVPSLTHWLYGNTEIMHLRPGCLVIGRDSSSRWRVIQVIFGGIVSGFLGIFLIGSRDDARRLSMGCLVLTNILSGILGSRALRGHAN